MAQAQLESIIRSYDPDATQIEVQPLNGGVAAQMWRLRWKDVAGEAREAILRSHGKRRQGRLAAEVALLQLLHRRGLPVNAVLDINLEPDQRAYLWPAPYALLQAIDGHSLFDTYQAPYVIAPAADALATIHRQALGHPTLAALPRQWEQAIWQIHHRPDHLDTSLNEGAIRTALRSDWPLAQVNDDVLLHGDFWPGNWLWKSRRLVGVIDWEDSQRGDPLADLSISRLDVLWVFGAAAMQEFTAIYQAQMPHLNYHHLPLWDLMAALRPMGQIEKWAAGWPEQGRPDLSAEKLRTVHQDFVAQALARLKT